MNNLPEKLQKIVKEVDQQIAPKLVEIEDQIVYNTAKVLAAYQANDVAEADLNGANGYGDDDMGRDKLDKIYAQVFQTEDAVVRPQFVSGTHTLFVALAGNLKYGDTLTYLTGQPYDTLQKVMTDDKRGTLVERGVHFSYVPLTDDGLVDYDEAEKVLKRDQPKIVAIQRSRGYSTRKTFTVDQIKDMIAFVKRVSPKSIVFIDNCYGEFSEKHEPTEYGADLMAGSLIKNAGGGLAKTGGYIVGKKDLVENAKLALTTPGCTDEGATIGNLHDFYEGFFLAPNVTGMAEKGMIFAAALFAKMGLNVTPAWDEKRSDIIETIIFGDPDKMVKFVQEVQKNSPIDSFVTPEAVHMEGYEDKIIMAAGNFVSGSTIEFSADGPIRPPYAVYMQGGLTYAHDKVAIINAVRDTFFNKK
ncbi:aluminum resistance protein [Lactobacillus crispatus]|jgi:aluminum resistance protein|uniref:methionine gamma-lyase family protein n=1 Tax=Lactobacillus crispatus TaxID=47770 RepID=UPI0007641659|nr:aminotransferase class V-fold PLP-dependent enzyme [Lactobacillus crispatus]KWX58281.1 aluminum resistance protein [Lactobacillus crispatus]MCT7719711.1 methionine gamma-lyase family protein [Lactobacillus crispatus]MDK7330915.1 aminotransferase class V-fold PLP-dependent enzyme [Lactobacillus crispatus]MDK7344082.1 aminotransferase class V-fold PLP-dependent enzyme [Lactobacillus crispatus]QGS05823.1 aminotransferase class V-fold PLP-dependent enzyme [Lactobacillus crispatus]